MVVAPVLGVLRVAGPVVGNADAAGKSDAAVDHQQLAVRAVIHAPKVVPAQRPILAESRRPPAVIVSIESLSIFWLPSQSTSTLTLTPARARSASASAKRFPISPDQ